MERRYKIVTLCGSTKFKEQILAVQKKLTLEGKIVIPLGLFSQSDDNVWGNMDEATIVKTKAMLDDMHKSKIDISDEIFVVNVGGYIGESTKTEIGYALEHGKKVRYLNEVN